jgi:hypothetical protein
MIIVSQETTCSSLTSTYQAHHSYEQAETTDFDSELGAWWVNWWRNVIDQKTVPLQDCTLTFWSIASCQFGFCRLIAESFQLRSTFGSSHHTSVGKMSLCAFLKLAERHWHSLTLSFIFIESCIERGKQNFWRVDNWMKALLESTTRFMFLHLLWTEARDRHT